MSKVMIFSKPPMAEVRTAPTMPPAGPDRIESLPWNSAASVRPPFDRMNMSRAPPRAAATWST